MLFLVLFFINPLVFTLLSPAVKAAPNAGSFFFKQSVSPEKIAKGRLIYNQHCVTCHQAGGEGMKGVFPPLLKSDFIKQNRQKAISAISNGLDGEITVNGQQYDGSMPNLGLSDEDAANVATFVFNSFGNSGGDVTLEDISKVRKNKK